LTGPAAGASFTAPATVNLTANASDSDGTVSKVEFFQGSTKLGEDTTSPYAFSWTSVAAGTYSVTAKATDNAGAVTTSAALTVTVGSAPVDGPNYAVNGTLDANLTGWSAQLYNYGVSPAALTTPPADMVTRQTTDVSAGAGALRLNLANMATMKSWSHNTGALCKLNQKALKGTKVTVTFAAKAVSGSTAVKVGRLWGGSSSVSVTATNTWKTYTVTVDLTADTDTLVFTLTDGLVGDPRPVRDGVVLIDQVSVTWVPASAG
jgi:chitinase